RKTSRAEPNRNRNRFLDGQVVYSHRRLSNNGCVMPLDVEKYTEQINMCVPVRLPADDCTMPAICYLSPFHQGRLQFFPINEEFPVSLGHKLMLIKSLSVIYTVNHNYQIDCLKIPLNQACWDRHSIEKAV
uniref:Uncharacterized protein n=1 Tax=Leptobrachium leishanense TaxID=445787 RepID=A0A8C5QA42_9ANUR